MYKVINENAHIIVTSFDVENEIRKYLSIQEMISVGQFNNDFRELFKTFYAMKPFYDRPEFSEPFFQLLQDYDDQDLPEVLDVMSRWNGKINFSFATKLIHSRNTSSPIYDSLVGKLFFIDEVRRAPNENEFQLCFRKFNFLCTEYRRIKDLGLLEEVVDLFNRTINNNNEIGEIKVFDFILWKFAKILNSGALIDRRITFS